MQKLAYFSVYLIFTLSNVSSFSVLRFYKFIPKYLINVDAILNGISKILLSNCSLLRTSMAYSSFPNRGVGKPGYGGILAVLTVRCCRQDVKSLKEEEKND